MRLGRDKTREIVDGSSLLQEVVSGLGLFDCEVIIVTAAEQSPLLAVDYPKLRIVGDTFSGKGALGGIYTGLMTSNSHYNLIVACDMPFLNHDLLDYMIQLSPDYDAVVPRVGDMVEPLHTVYSKACLVSIEQLFKRDTLHVNALFSLVNVRYVDTGEIDQFDPEHLSFFNVNTEDDLTMARELADKYKTATKITRG